MVQEIGSARDAGIPRGTRAADEWGFKKVKLFAQDIGARWMRPYAHDVNINVLTETWFVALALFWIVQHMAPSSRRAARGFMDAQPQSGLLAIYGWLRVQRDCGRYRCDMTEVKRVAHGMCIQYKAIWGPEAFEKQQAAVMSNGMLLAIEKCLQSHQVPNWSAAEHDMWDFAHTFEISTGMRKDEVTEAYDGDDFLKRGNFKLVDVHGVYIIMTTDNIAAMSNGSILEVTSVPSKCDRLNMDWSKQKMFFIMDDSKDLNLAAAFKRYEIRYPCPLAERKRWPAFSPTGDANTMSPWQADRMFQRILEVSVPAHMGGVKIHSYRATLASKMCQARSAGHKRFDDSVIQAHLRWKTLASLMSYSKMTPETFARNVQIAIDADAGFTIHDDTPIVEPREALEEMQASMAAMSVTHVPVAKPASKAVDAPQAKPSVPTSKEVMVVGYDEPFTALAPESWNVLGSKINLPNAIWGEEDGGSTMCTIDHYIGKVRFADQRTMKHAYTVSMAGDTGNYAVTAATVTEYHDRKRALLKMPPPKVLSK